MSGEEGKSSKPNMFEEERKFEKLLSSLEGVKDTLEMIEREIPFVSGKTKWTPVLTRGFEGIAEDKKRFEEVALFFQNLGLGRGVDVTRTKPFDNKTAFQVKQVDYSNLIGTDEGGLLVDFRDIVLSMTDMSVEYQASLDIMKALGKQAAVLTGPLATLSTPLKFTASGELSRNEYSTRMVFGVRILNRTVSFQQTMDSVPTTITPNVYLIPRGTEQPPRDKEDTFEKRLTNWILEYYKHMKKESAGQSETGRMPNPTKSGESGEGEAASKEESSTDKPLKDIDSDTLDTLCEAYTWTTGVTHYVSSIKLGAEMYKTMDLRAYATTFKANASVNVLDIFTVGDDKTDEERGISREKRDIQNKYATKVIGRITEVKPPKAAQTARDQSRNGPRGDDEDTEEAALDVRPRKSYKVDPRDEAVIGYELRSVASLIVDDERLAEKMALAARKYIDENRRDKVGPYYIASHDMELGKTIYLKKGLGSTLTTTIKQCEASPFKIIPNEDDEKEFHIAYEAQDGNDHDTPTFRYYLTTRHKFSGVHSEPPSLEQHPKESNATFALHSQLHEWINTQEKLEEWISEGKCFLVNCENRKWARDSYFALKREAENDDKEEPPSHNFFPVCERYTNENDDLLFAFKLIRCPYGGKTPKQEQQQQQQQK